MYLPDLHCVLLLRTNNDTPQFTPFPPSCNITSQTLQCDTPPGVGWDQTVAVQLGGAVVSQQQFDYSADPTVEAVEPDCTLEQGEFFLASSWVQTSRPSNKCLGCI